MQKLFEEKYAQCEKSLFLVAIGYLHNTEDAKDCVQEAVLSAYKAFPRLREHKHFKTWLTRIVINKCKDFLRKHRHTEELTDDICILQTIPTEEIGIIDCICRLRPQLSVYITLRFYQDMTYEEVSKVLKQPVSTVKYQTKKALLELKELLEGDIR